MRTIRTLLLGIVMTVSLVDVPAACGDKFIRIGRELRFGRYIAVHPASILIYGPPGSAPSRIVDFAAILKRAGHSATVISSPGDLSSALRSGRFDLVLAGLAQAEEVARLTRGAPSPPDILPVLIKPRAVDIAAAEALSPCRINASAPHRNDALAEIDHRMELRLGVAPLSIRERR
jgi:hypothetical protein